MQGIRPEPQIPDMQAGKTASNKTDRLAASLQNEEDVVLQKQKENKAKKSSKSLINYQAIQAILKTELQAEADKDVQIAVCQQLELLEAILEFKLLNKKEKLNDKLQKPQEIALVPVQNQNQPKSYAEALQSDIQKKNEQESKQKA